MDWRRDIGRDRIESGLEGNNILFITIQTPAFRPGRITSRKPETLPTMEIY